MKRGIWLYDGTVESGIRILRADVFPGTADYEDPPEICDDREVECFEVRYESPAGSGLFPTGGGCFLTLAEAMAYIERMCRGMRWID